jgi:hypothetical protein
VSLLIVERVPHLRTKFKIQLIFPPSLNLTFSNDNFSVEVLKKRYMNSSSSFMLAIYPANLTVLDLIVAVTYILGRLQIIQLLITH